MLQGILIVVAFLVVAALMMTKKIPTLLALPLMAVVICIIAGVPMFGKNADGAEIGWLTTVFEAGTVRMGSAIMAVKILNGEADISSMPIEYTDVTKKYNKAICDDLGLTVPDGYEEIEG